MSRRRLRVEHGWNFVLSRDDPPELRGVWLYVMVFNVGGRTLAVEHLGYEWAQIVGELAPGVKTADIPRAEIPLKEPITLEPDGPSVKVSTPIGPLLRLGINPLEDPVWPVAFTTGETEWRGRVTELLPQLPTTLPFDTAVAGLERLRSEAEEPPLVTGGLYGLKREEPSLLEDG